MHWVCDPKRIPLCRYSHPVGTNSNMGVLLTKGWDAKPAGRSGEFEGRNEPGVGSGPVHGGSTGGAVTESSKSRVDSVSTVHVFGQKSRTAGGEVRCSERR